MAVIVTRITATLVAGGARLRPAVPGVAAVKRCARRAFRGPVVIGVGAFVATLGGWFAADGSAAPVAHGTRAAHAVTAIVAPPSGQWIATGRISQTNSVEGDSAGQQQIRAWIFRRVCAGGGNCHTDFTQSDTDGSTIRTTLVSEGSGSFRGTFRVSRDPCTNGGSSADHYAVSFTRPSSDKLVGMSTETFNDERGGCSPGGFNITRYSARPVARPRTQSLEVSPTHATTIRAFRTAAQQTCTSVTAEALRIVADVKSAQRTLQRTSSRSVKATSEARIATLVGEIQPLLGKQYTDIPQPPRGPLDTLWIREIADVRAELKPSAAIIAVLQTTARAASRYFHDDNTLELQRVATGPALLVDDLAQLAGPARASATIARQLQLPAVCASESATGAILA